MIFSRWIDKLFRRPATPRRPASGRSRRRVPSFEILEDRLAPAVFTVTTLTDAPPSVVGSLRNALALNAADGGGNTIVFEPQLQGTMTVGSPLQITAPVNIVGYFDNNPTDNTYGQPIVAISGGNKVQVFNVNNALPGVTNFVNLEIKDGTTNSGGGIFVGKSDTVTFNNVTLDHNSANTGGGVYCATGGNLIFVNSSIDNNSAAGAGKQQGGGMWIDKASIVNLYNSEVNDNSAQKSGGGFYLSGDGTLAGNSTLTVDTVPTGFTVPGVLTYFGKISNPPAPYVEQPYAGFSIIAGDISPSQVNFNNAGTDGGAIYSNGVVTINSLVPTAPTQVNQNTAGVAGAIASFNGTGGLPGPGTQEDATLNVLNSVMDSNASKGSEGAIYAQGLLTMTNTEVGSNTAGKAAGAITFSGPGPADTATLTNVTVDNNTAALDTGGIDNYGNMVIIGSTIGGPFNSQTGKFTGNTAGTEVGGIRNNSGVLWLINSTIANNQANGAVQNSDDGGGLLEDGGTVHIINSTISGNATANGRGGGIMLEAPEATTLIFTMQNSIVAGNTASGEAQGPDVYAFPAAPNNTYTVQYSLIGDGSGTFSNGSYIAGTSTATGGVNGNLVGPDIANGQSGSPINAQLGPLQNNGGPTPNPSFTMALPSTSPAVNAGNNMLAVDNHNNALQYDQRGPGFPRIINGTVDMGAYEYGPPITITPTTLPTGFVGVVYNGSGLQITAGGGSGSFHFNVTVGSLPPGLTLSSSGLLSGTPTTTAGSPFTFTVTATDNNSGATGNQVYTMVIDSQLFINGTLPAGTINKPYSATLTGTGGSGTGYTMTETGTLPMGISYNTTGGTINFTGTPTQTGSFPISVTVTDSTNGSFTKNYTLVIYAVLGLNPATVPTGALGSSYSVTFSGTGGTGTGYSYTESGPLDGLTFNPATGLLSGTPTAAGSFSFSVTVKDSSGATATNNYTLTVNPAIVISPASPLPAGTAGSVYTQPTPFSATGGAGGPYTFSESGTIPGLNFNTSSDTLVGTPSQSGTFNFTVTATDSGGASASKNYSITINPAVTITPATLNSGTQGIGYTQTLTASGGNGSSFTFTGPGTVDGLTFTDNANGTATIAGTPTSTGSFPYTVSVTNTAGATDTVNYTLVIGKPLSIATFAPLNNPTNVFPAWAALNGPYNVSFIASGGTGPYTYTETPASVVGSTPGLPPGISFNGNTASGSTAPTAFGTYSFTIKATDSVGTVGQQTYTINIEPQIKINPTTLPAGTNGVLYVQSTPLTATGGSGIGLKLVGETGALPAGLIFNPGTGYFVGTPSATSYGSYPITVTATDANGGLGTQAYTLQINFTLGNSANDKFVTAVYNKLLLRNPDPGAQVWVNLLNAGVAPSTIVKAIEGSTEYLTDLLTSTYSHYLGRGLDPTGASYWVGQLAGGASIQSVTANILASTEYFNKQQKYGNSDPNVNFIIGLYNDVLGRTPSSAEINTWLSFIDAGIVRNGSSANALALIRYNVALDFLTSAEYYNDLVGGGGIWNGSYPVYPWNGFYNTFLYRAADAGGLASWVGALGAGTSEQTVLADIFGSPEGYLKNS